MTTLTRPVRRKVPSRSFGTLVVTLAPEGVWIREARRRVAYLAEYGVLYQSLVRAAVDADKRAKAKARKARRVPR